MLNYQRVNFLKLESLQLDLGGQSFLGILSAIFRGKKLASHATWKVPQNWIMANFLLLRERHPTKQIRSTIPTSSFKGVVAPLTLRPIWFYCCSCFSLHATWTNYEHMEAQSTRNMTCSPVPTKNVIPAWSLNSNIRSYSEATFSTSKGQTCIVFIWGSSYVSVW
jgi:hypothetical protein